MDRPGTPVAVLATILVVQPALQLAEQATDPQLGASSHGAAVAVQVAAIAQHPHLRLLSVLLGIAALVLFVPMVLTIRRLLRVRSPRLARAGSALCLTGVIAFAALHGMDLATLAVIQAPGVEHVTAAGAITSSSASGPLTVVFLVGMMIGMLLLSVGLWRTRVVPRAAAVLLVAFLVLDFGAAVASSKPLTVAAHALLLAGSALIARSLLLRRSASQAVALTPQPSPAT